MKIGVQSGRTVNEIGKELAYKTYAECGFQSVDWNINDYFDGSCLRKDGPISGGGIFEKSVDEIADFLQEELDEIHKNGLVVNQAHAPFPCYITGKPETLDYMIKIYNNIIKYCDRIDCKYLVIHGASLKKNNNSQSLEDIADINYKLYRSLIPTLKNTNVTVCLENLFARNDKISYAAGACSNPYEAAELIDKLNLEAGKECFGLCLDTGHLNLLRIDCRAYIPVLGNRIKALHIHDNDGITDQHKAPYTGDFNFRSFCEELKKINYDGDLSFETFMQTTTEIIDEDMIAPWLNLICQIGESFKNKIKSIN